MNLDILSMLIGGGILATGGILGIFATMLLQPSAPRPEPSPYTCGCTHALAVHDPETNKCHALVEIQKYNRYNSPAGKEHMPCACRQYVGERPVDVEAVLHDFTRKHPTPPAPQDRT